VGTLGVDRTPEVVHELRPIAQLRMLHSLARRLNQMNDVRQIGEAITAELRTVIQYHNCRVHLIDDVGQMLVPIAFRGELSEYQGETFEALLVPLGQGVTGRVAQTGDSYYSPNTTKDPYAVTIPGTPDVDESLLVVPLKYGSAVIGTVGLAKLGVDQFDQEDLRVLEVLASHAAVAIQNARLLASARTAARRARESEARRRRNGFATSTTSRTPSCRPSRTTCELPWPWCSAWPSPWIATNSTSPMTSAGT